MRSPAQRANRTACRHPATISSTPESQCIGVMIQVTSANALMTIATMSNCENGTGNRPGLLRVSQLLVKLGTIRPPISEIIRMTAAMAMRVP